LAPRVKSRPSASFHSKRRRPSGNDNDGKERVPFLVPLMMVPETDVGVEKPFSFAQEQTGFGGNGFGNFKASQLLTKRSDFQTGVPHEYPYLKVYARYP
jgi:hypothetical protein